MRLLVVTDIFGDCAGLKGLLRDLAAVDTLIQVIDPYQGQAQNFTDEQQAYSAYSQQCGHDTYAERVANTLQSAAQPFDVVISFSAGATALWRNLANPKVTKIKQAIMFYPGQIHRHLALEPQMPSQIIFGNSEPHFAVADICNQLHQKPAVTVSVTPFAHGFLNSASNAFNEAGYQQYLAVLKQLF
mgnify:CR=1 FL=1